MMAHRFEDSRSGDRIARQGYRGILLIDCYAANNRLGKDRGDYDAMTLAGCWTHAGSNFFDLHASDGSPFARAAVKAMAPLWAIEVAELFRELPRLSGKSKLVEAIRYPLSRRPVLERFLADGRIDIDSNMVERANRPQTIARKNALFAGSDG